MLAEVINCGVRRRVQQRILLRPLDTKFKVSIAAVVAMEIIVVRAEPYAAQCPVDSRHWIRTGRVET